MISSGCSTLHPEFRTPKSAVQLPPAPSFMAPVAVPGVKAGDDAREKLAEARAVIKRANGRLTQSRGWYGGVRDRYGKASLR